MMIQLIHLQSIVVEYQGCFGRKRNHTLMSFDKASSGCYYWALYDHSSYPGNDFFWSSLKEEEYSYTETFL